MTSSSPVCRTCLGIISDGKTFYNIDDENGIVKNVRNIRDMLTFCVPEMDIFISVSPSICETCLDTLVGVYNFKIRCLRVENAIRSYIVANNVMEGSCVDLSNVVKLQIMEALKQKNWPQDVIREYIWKVDACLKRSRKNNPVPPGVFSAMSQSFNSPLVGGTVPGNVMPPRSLSSSQPNVMPVPQHVLQASLRPAQLANTSYSPSNLPQNNPVLNQLLNVSHEACKDTQPQNVPLSKGYISVSKNLMPPEPQRPLFSQQSSELYQRSSNPNVLHSVGLTPNLSRSEPLNNPVVHTFPTIENIQNGLLNSMNSGDREEAVLVTPQAKTSSGSSTSVNNSVIASKKDATKNPLRSARKEPRKELCPVTGMVREVKSDERYQTGLRNVRSYLGPKSKRKTKLTETVDTVIIDDDDDERKKDDDEVLIMNFDEDENAGRELTLLELLKSSDISNTSTKKTAKPSTPQSKQVVVKLPQIDKETMKRKLSPEDVIEEIQSKRKRLIVNLNPALPYLHANKKLMVKVRRDTFYKCLLCSFTAVGTNDLKVHYQRCHRLCKLCDYKCNKKPSLDEHITAQHLADLKKAIKYYGEEKTDFHCYLCQFVGLSVFDLRDHRLRVHIKCNESGFYKCPFESCDAEDAIAYNVLRHTEGKHDIPRRKECPLCNHIAMSHQGLKLHVQSHSLLNKLTCPLCSLTFKTAFHLQKHVQRKHYDDGREGYKPGMVYGPTSGPHGNLTADEDGRITLNQPTSSQQALNPPTNMNEDASSLGFVSLSEMLCTQILQEIPEQEDDCTIVDNTRQASDQRRIILNKHNKKSQKRGNDSEDCVIISDGQQGIMTVDLSDDDNTPASKRTKTNGSGADVIEIIDEDPSEDGPANVCSSEKDAETSEPPVVQERQVVESTGGNNNVNNSEARNEVANDAESRANSIENNSETSSQLLEKLLDEHFSESSSVAAAKSQIDETSGAAASSEGISIDLSEEDRNTNVQSKSQEEKHDDLNKEVKSDTANNSNTSPNKDDNDQSSHDLTSSATVENNSSDIQKNVSDTQDSDDNIIVSDSESEKSAVIRKRLDMELTGKSPKKFAKYPSDMFQTDSEVEVDNNDLTSSSISVLNDEDLNSCEVGSDKIAAIGSKEVENVSKEKDSVHEVPSEISSSSTQQITDGQSEVDKSKLVDGEATGISETTNQKATEGICHVGSQKDDHCSENREESPLKDRPDGIIEDIELTNSVDDVPSETSSGSSQQITDSQTNGISETTNHKVTEGICNAASKKDDHNSENREKSPLDDRSDGIIEDTEPINSVDDVSKESSNSLSQQIVDSQDEVDTSELADGKTTGASETMVTGAAENKRNDTEAICHAESQEDDYSSENCEKSPAEDTELIIEASTPPFISEAPSVPEDTNSSESLREVNEKKLAEDNSKTDDDRQDVQANAKEENKPANSETLSTSDASSTTKEGSDANNDAEGIATSQSVPIQSQSEAPTAPQSSSNDAVEMSKSVQQVDKSKHPENDSETDSSRQDAQPNAIEDSETANSGTLSTTDTCSINREGSDSNNDAETVATSKSVPVQSQSEAPTVPEGNSNDGADIPKLVNECPENDSKSDDNRQDVQPNAIDDSESVNIETLSAADVSSIDIGGSDMNNDAEAVATTNPVLQSESVKTKDQTTDASVADAESIVSADVDQTPISEKLVIELEN